MKKPIKRKHSPVKKKRPYFRNTPRAIRPREVEGMKMIIALQAYIGVQELEGTALNAWRRFTSKEKRNTEAAYYLFCV